MLLLIALNTIRQASFLNENSGDGVSTQFCDDGYDSYNSASFSAPGFYASIWDSVYNDGCGMVHNQGVSASSSGRYSSMPGSHVPSQGGVYYDYYDYGCGCGCGYGCGTGNSCPYRRSSMIP